MLYGRIEEQVRKQIYVGEEQDVDEEQVLDKEQVVDKDIHKDNMPSLIDSGMLLNLHEDEDPFMINAFLRSFFRSRKSPQPAYMQTDCSLVYQKDFVLRGGGGE